MKHEVSYRELDKKCQQSKPPHGCFLKFILILISSTYSDLKRSKYKLLLLQSSCMHAKQPFNSSYFLIFTLHFYITCLYFFYVRI